MKIDINQQVAILIDGNNIERAINTEFGEQFSPDYDIIVPKILGKRSLTRLIYFREGKTISQKFARRLHNNFYGTVQPCHKSADVPITIKAMQLAEKVDTIMIMSGDSDYVELVKHLKHQGVRVEVMSPRICMSGILKDIADRYEFISKKDLYEYKKDFTREEVSYIGNDADGKQFTSVKDAETFFATEDNFTKTVHFVIGEGEEQFKYTARIEDNGNGGYMFADINQIMND